MANPYFSNSDVFGDPNRRRNHASTRPDVDTSAYHQYGYSGPGTATATAVRPAASTPGTVDPATLDLMYGAPSATTLDTKRLSYDDVIVKAGTLLALLVAVAAATWVFAPGLWGVGMVVGLVLGIVNSVKREPSPALIALYTAAQGVFLGGISFAFQAYGINGVPVSGLVFQAVLATIVTVAATLALYRSGRVRVTAKFQRWVMIALVSFLAFQLINLALVMFGLVPGAGARSGTLGIIVGLVAIGIATSSLITDFDMIKRGVEGGAPARFAWSAAFGLMVTLVWLYLEFLRLFALLNQRR